VDFVVLLIVVPGSKRMVHGCVVFRVIFMAVATDRPVDLEI